MQKIGTHTVHNKKSAHLLMGDEWMIEGFPCDDVKNPVGEWYYRYLFQNTRIASADRFYLIRIK